MHSEALQVHRHYSFYPKCPDYILKKHEDKGRPPKKPGKGKGKKR